jgi:hypothetical protein
MNEYNIEAVLNEAVELKEDLVGKLITILKSTDDFYTGNQVAFTLVENFKDDDRIESCLVDLIKDSRWKNHNGTLLYLLGEYTNNKKYLYFLIDIILNNEKDDDGEVFMGAYSMIINLHPPLDVKEISRALQRVRREEKKENMSTEQEKLVNSLLNYLEGQQKIVEFYSQFGSDMSEV